MRVAILSYNFAKYLNLEDDLCYSLKIGALLHDLGKFYLNYELLYKESKLSQEEFILIKSHILCDFEKYISDNLVGNCIKYHHEKINSKGYIGLSYSSIPQEAHIISIIDTFDAMSNKRCYRKEPVKMNDIINELKGLSGIHYNSYYCNSFIDFIKENSRLLDYLKTIQ